MADIEKTITAEEMLRYVHGFVHARQFVPNGEFDHKAAIQHIQDQVDGYFHGIGVEPR